MPNKPKGGLTKWFKEKRSSTKRKTSSKPIKHAVTASGRRRKRNAK